MEPATKLTEGAMSPFDDPYDLVTIGETMTAFVAREGEQQYSAYAAGAESNVAAGMSQLGLRTRWVSRLGDDQLGRLVARLVDSRGVDVAVDWDDTRQTGVMMKHLTGRGAAVHYYRRDSAARKLSVADLQRAGVARWMHVSGITPALSPSAAELVVAVLDRASGHDGGVSLDINYRPALWPDAATAAEILVDLARRADVVFIGNDEAEVLFGTADTPTLADLILLHDDQELVVKRGAGPATVVTRQGETSQPAVAVQVVDETGAGDAFAAGYLAAMLFGWDSRARLMLGHVLAARVVGVRDDVPPPPTGAELSDLSPTTVAAQWEARPAGEP